MALSLKNLKYLCLIIHFISYTLSETVICDNYFFSKIKYNSLFKTILCTHKPENPKPQIPTGKLTYVSHRARTNAVFLSWQLQFIHCLPSDHCLIVVLFKTCRFLFILPIRKMLIHLLMWKVLVRRQAQHKVMLWLISPKHFARSSFRFFFLLEHQLNTDFSGVT